MIADDLTALRQVADRYADAVDRRDGEALVALFTDDGVLKVQGDEGPAENVWAGREVVRSFDVLEGFYRTFHHVGGCVFESTGPDSAAGRVKCLAHHYERTGNGPVDLVMMINYHDTYRHDGIWRIAERRVAIEWTELHPAHPRRKVRA